MKKKVSFYTLGCRLNFSETSAIADGFVQRGYEVVPFEKAADVVFMNTCTVTDGADSSCRNMIRRAQRFSPEAKIVVSGCYAQMEAEKVKKMEGVDLILGTSERHKVFDYLDYEDEVTVKIEKTNDFWGAATSLAGDHTRAFLKVQDGCNYVCSFCIIPFARGRSRAISIAQAKEEARKIINNGFKEIVLTGVNIGEYLSSSGEKFEDLAREILSLEGLKRLRMSSVEVNTITRELLEVLKKSGKYQDHFHIPMQSGDDTILKSMRRKYDVDYYKKNIYLIKEYFPNAAIGADIIVGYPGESEEQFQNTYKLLEELPITHFHVFPYSRRKGTSANRLDNHLQVEIKKDRVKKLIALGDKKLELFSKAQLGSQCQVLFEKEDKAGYFTGYTPHYLKVKCKSSLELSNKITQVTLDRYEGGFLYATLNKIHA